MQQRYILYQAYGNEGILLECKFSLMQLLKCNDPDSFCVILYTDNPDFFKPVLQHFVHHEIALLTPALIKQWRGDINFVHRIKIEMLLDFFSRHTGSVIYLDTDTYCNASLAPLFDAIEKGSIFMHTCEGKLGDKTNIGFRRWIRFLNSNRIMYKGERITGAGSIQMWNAGVLGFSDQYLPVLKDVLQLTETIYPVFPKHTVEQFAFSFVFKKMNNLQAAEDIIYHYWDLKEYRDLLQNFFERNQQLPLEEQTNKLQHLLPEKIFGEKMNHKKMLFFRKWFKPTWSIEPYKEQLG